MQKNDFGLRTHKWKTLLDTSTSLLQIEQGFPPTVNVPKDNVVVRFAQSTLAKMQKRPSVLNKVPLVLRIVLPDILQSILREENHGKTIHVDKLLVDVLDTRLTPKDLRCIVDTTCLVVQTMDAIYALLHPSSPTPKMPRAQVAPSPDMSADNGELKVKLDQVVAMVREFAETELMDPYLRLHAPGRNVQKFQQASFRLCMHATYAKRDWSVGPLRSTMMHAMDASFRLVREITQCHGFLEELETLVSTKTGTHRFPPLLASFCQRAMLNFTHEAHGVLAHICPDAIPIVFSGSGQDGQTSPSFHDFRLINMVKHQALFFDTWMQSANTACLFKDLLLLVNIFKDIVKTPPLSLFVQHTSLSKTLAHIHAATASKRFDDMATHMPTTSPAVVAKAVDFAALPDPPPVVSLVHIYQRLIKRLAKEALFPKRKFVLEDVVAYFQAFYHHVQPPVFHSGILAMRVYQVYRDASYILGLPLDTTLPEKAFFQDHLPETLVPDPYAWIPPPLARRSVAQGVSMCRDLVLAYVQEAQLPDTWIERLAEFVTGNRVYTKDEVLVEYQLIHSFFDTPS